MNTKGALGSLEDCVAYARAVATLPLRDKEWRKALSILRKAVERKPITIVCPKGYLDLKDAMKRCPECMKEKP